MKSGAEIETNTESGQWRESRTQDATHELSKFIDTTLKRACCQVDSAEWCRNGTSSFPFIRVRDFWFVSGEIFCFKVCNIIYITHIHIEAEVADTSEAN